MPISVARNLPLRKHVPRTTFRWPWLAVALVALVCFADMTRGADEDDDDARCAIFVMNVDGTAVHKVVFIEAFKAFNGVVTLGAPRWSHDGQRLAFMASGDKPGRVLSIDATGRNLLDLGAGAMPDWSPDDKQVVFEVPNVGGASVWVQNADGKGNNWLAAGAAPRWSPDGSQIAALGPLRTLDVVDGVSRNVLDVPNLGEAVGCDWSPDGKRLALIVDNNKSRRVIIVSAEGASKGLAPRWRGDLHAALGWSPDGKKLAIGVFDERHQAYRLHLIDPDGNGPPVEIPGQEGDNREPAWSPDGKQLAFASSRTSFERRTATLARPEAKLELVRRHDKGGTVYSLALSPDGRTAFLGGDMADRKMQVWDVASGEPLRSIKVPGIFVAISPDGQRAACAEFLGGDVQYLNLEDGTVIREFAHGAQVISLAFSEDGSRLVSAGVDKSVCIFDVAGGTELRRIRHAEDLKQVAISPDGTLLATTSTDKKLRLWETDTGKPVREFEHPAVPWSVTFSPDGRCVATGTGGEMFGKRSDFNVTPANDNAVRVWNAKTGKLVHELAGHTHVVASVAFSPNGRRLVSASFDRSLRLWDFESGRELSRAEGKGWFTRAVFTPHGNFVLAGGGAEKNIQTDRWYEAPDERVRLYRIAETGQAAPAKN